MDLEGHVPSARLQQMPGMATLVWELLMISSVPFVLHLDVPTCVYDFATQFHVSEVVVRKHFDTESAA